MVQVLLIIAFDLCHVLSATRMEHENLVKAVGSMYDLTPPPFLKSRLFNGHVNAMRCTVHDTRLGSLNLVYGFIYRQILFLTTCALGLTGDLWPTKLLVRLQREVYAPLVR